MNRTARLLALAVTGASLTVSLALPSSAYASGTPTDSSEHADDSGSETVTGGASYPGDPGAESLLVAAEDRRIV
jgi:hypothetical protein